MEAPKNAVNWPEITGFLGASIQISNENQGNPIMIPGKPMQRASYYSLDLLIIPIDRLLSKFDVIN